MVFETIASTIPPLRPGVSVSVYAAQSLTLKPRRSAPSGRIRSDPASTDELVSETRNNA